MSWSVQFIGKPEKVVEALNENSKKMIDVQSKMEFDSALPYLIGIVKENFGFDYAVKLTASGHGYSVNGEQKNRQLAASIEIVYGLLV
jgi:hypothetical protein